MTDQPRVAITGIGLISSIGCGARATIDAVARGSIGVRRIQAFDTTGFSCRIAAEIPTEWIPDTRPELDRFSNFALVAAAEARKQSGLSEAPYAPARVGTLIGTGLGGCETLDSGYERMYGRGLTRIPPMTIPRSMYNAATSAIAAAFDARGPAFGIVSACSSGAHAIGQAASWIRSGLADAVFAGGADAPIVPGIIRAWEGLRILAHDRDGPEAACRPFSLDRSGIVLGEGGAILLLERMDMAVKRGATILGEILGVGFSSDAGHVTDPSPDGAAAAIYAAIEDARLPVESIGYVNAHGTATRANDRAETRAVRKVFGSWSDGIQVSSTKAMHGHAMGATGAIELALSLLCLNAGIIPPTMNYRVADPDCDLDYVPNAARESDVGIFASSSFGFGGLNAVLVVRTARSTR